MKIQIKNEPNRAARRGTLSREKHLKSSKVKSRLAEQQIMGTKLRQEALAKRIAATVARREARDVIKQKIAKKEGVNVCRVALNLPNGSFYTIRAGKSGEKNRTVIVK